ncbi:MAG: MBL fold metallo-hydrolase [Actinomycetota bacterium]|nr:MBL fold metallo-hydrolase [Actinomycetota bacterium]
MPLNDIAPTTTLSVVFLGSGSSGNATAVRWSGGTVLLDCGFSARETMRRLAEHAIPAEEIRAILVTHEHGDHVRGVRVLASRLGVPVYATRGTLHASRLEREAADTRVVCAGEQIAIDSLEVTTFAVSHDATEPVGFRFRSPDGVTLGVVTDTGHLTPEAAEALSGCNLLGIECNHDVEMLTGGPYPWFLKQRILSTRGHLSNDAAGDAVRVLAHDVLESVFALHISRQNNVPGLAVSAVTQALAELGLEVPVTPVAQDCACACTR